jgi:hypothetical protein
LKYNDCLQSEEEKRNIISHSILRGEGEMKDEKAGTSFDVISDKGVSSARAEQRVHRLVAF